MCLKDAGRMANSVNPDKTAPSDLGLHCLPITACLKLQDSFSSDSDREDNVSDETICCAADLALHRYSPGRQGLLLVYPFSDLPYLGGKTL